MQVPGVVGLDELAERDRVGQGELDSDDQDGQTKVEDFALYLPPPQLCTLATANSMLVVFQVIANFIPLDEVR